VARIGGKEGLGAVRCGKQHEDAVAGVVLHQQGLGLGRGLEAGDAVLLVLHRHEHLRVEQAPGKFLGNNVPGVEIQEEGFQFIARRGGVAHRTLLSTVRR
jgi:hypothetical protein